MLTDLYDIITKIFQSIVPMACFSSRLWIFFTVIVLAIMLCVRLGFWQLRRAEQKGQMMRQHQVLAKQDPELLTKQSKPIQYQPIKLEGRFRLPLFYLDNQHYQHQFGYDIISPFQTNDGLIVLVNRGWVAGDISRKRLPEISVYTQLTTVEGYAYYPQKNAWRLGPQIETRQGGNYLLEQVDIDALHDLLPKPFVASFMLRLNKNSSYGFVRAWPIVSMSPNRHRGYAVQWFVMALGLVIMMAYFLKRQYERKSK